MLEVYRDNPMNLVWQRCRPRRFRNRAQRDGWKGKPTNGQYSMTRTS